MNNARSYQLTEFGKLCKQGRSRFEMTRPEMAKKMGHPAGLISDIESGKVKPTEEYICHVTGLLALSTEEVRKALKRDTEIPLSNFDNVIPFRR